MAKTGLIQEIVEIKTERRSAHRPTPPPTKANSVPVRRPDGEFLFTMSESSNGPRLRCYEFCDEGRHTSRLRRQSLTISEARLPVLCAQYVVFHMPTAVPNAPPDTGTANPAGNHPRPTAHIHGKSADWKRRHGDRREPAIPRKWRPKQENPPFLTVRSRQIVLRSHSGARFAECPFDDADNRTIVVATRTLNFGN